MVCSTSNSEIFRRIDVISLARANTEAAQGPPPPNLLNHLLPRRFLLTVPVVGLMATRARDIQPVVVAVLQDTVAIKQSFATQA